MLKIEEVVKISPVIPVCVIEDIKDVLPLAKALQDGGINICEITLRTDVALQAIKEISHNLPDMIVGVGSVKNLSDYTKSIEHGSRFVVTPGLVPQILTQAIQDDIPILPGVMSPTEILTGLNLGIEYFKLFPASLAGGVNFLKAVAGPIADAKFCPTGGISLENMNEFLECKNVACVGGTWLTPKELIKDKEFKQITKIVQKTLSNIK